jgi:hypothetical protein
MKQKVYGPEGLMAVPARPSGKDFLGGTVKSVDI